MAAEKRSWRRLRPRQRQHRRRLFVNFFRTLIWGFGFYAVKELLQGGPARRQQFP
jgi:hypothetical protein